ncbi:hypothetical protein [Allocoleopsis franciscana]|uniref:Uncharacterized protein n=1 Tax=Allocoleopsis franciscana PCC 7113 TaxID=1173027 RepID=K9WEM9_9CYAN|nr:hypothetical protein [Allocoleopsis franciscana]AFZ18865.1 hypothetical protein Mic7113_3117 [Allocoleopsis franciscana PCC 7113]
MRPESSVWQGNFGYWQNRFIQQNILLIGYTAWNGYLNTGQGIVVCNVVDTISSVLDWEVDSVTFHQEFIPQAQVEAYLQALELQLEAVTALLKAITTYDPNQAIVLLVIGNGVVDINLLNNLKISPADCYAQVQHRWIEFNLT